MAGRHRVKVHGDFTVISQGDLVPNHSKVLYAIAKRALDVVLGGVLFILSTPIILLAAAAVWLESSGSPFFIQTRIGLNGKPFKIFKLRGMHIDARERFPELYDYQKFDNLDFHFHYEPDPRITRVGRFLRRASIDELPNFLNVVLGSMSLVGPRPEIPEVLTLYMESTLRYISVKPGVTCLSKITGRDLLTKRQSMELDLGYIERMSFGLDLQILWRTFGNVLFLRDKVPQQQEFVTAKAADQPAPVSSDTDYRSARSYSRNAEHPQ
jgi:lipopolysaccharide/colanic/teichoic acid biosynthesis glycosyltransferase